MQTPVIFIIGHPQHGKTSLRKALEKLTHLKGASCSDVVYHFLALRGNTSVDALKLLPKEEFRPKLMEAGDFLVGKLDKMQETAAKEGVDEVMYRIPSALIRTLYMSGYNLIDGVRRREELASARDHLDWNGVPSKVVWVERPGHEIIPDNNELAANDADAIVLNDGTIEEIDQKAFEVLEKLFGPQPDLQKPVEVVEPENLAKRVAAATAAEAAA